MTGVVRSATTGALMPSRPSELLPQQTTSRSDRKLHVCIEPAETDTAVVSPETDTGMELEVVLPSPS
jgi:hypothetical protein